MKDMAVLGCMVVLLLPPRLLASSKAYDVVPYRNCVGQSPSNTPVVQYIRMTLDSVTAVSFWVGDTIDTSGFNVRIADSATDERIAHREGYHTHQDWGWMNVPLYADPVYKPVRGRTYEVRITRPTRGTAISFAYCDTNPYKYGMLSVPGQQPPVPLNWDLALRVTGTCSPIDSSYWGFLAGARDAEQRTSVVKAKADTAGVRLDRIDLLWHEVEPTAGSFTYLRTDSIVGFSHDSMRCEVIGLLDYCSKWASSRITYNQTYGLWDTSIACAPVNLFYGVGEPQQFWGRYVESIVHRYGGSVSTYECWNEPSHMDRFWQLPNRYYNIDTTARARCSLYVRLCWVAAKVLESASDTNRLLIGSMSQVNASDPEIGLVAGKTWLRLFYELSEEMGYGVFWDGVAIHPYQWPGFNADEFDADAETIRTIMRSHGDDGVLYATELGWDHEMYGEEQQADYLSEMFVATKATDALPGGGYDRICWYSFLNRTDDFGLVREAPDYESRAGLYASRHTRDALLGKQFIGRVLLDDAAADTIVRIYEFEEPQSHKRTYVAWREWTSTDGSNPPSPVNVEVPVLTDTLEVTGLHYGGNLPQGPAYAATDGWLPVPLEVRPVFIEEQSDTTRPDLRADSVRLVPATPLVGETLVIQTWVTNHGTRSVPDGAPGGLKFYHNGYELGTRQWQEAIDQGHSEMFCYVVPAVPDSWHGLGLYSVSANPGQSFVELGTDDNGAYRRARTLRRPTGEVDLVMPPGGRTNVPMVALRLVSHSLEADTTGSTPCDSARLVQWWYGISDTAVQAGDTTAWFSVSQDTTFYTDWRFLHGQGVYHILRATEGLLVHERAHCRQQPTGRGL